MKLEEAREIAKQLSEPPAIIFHSDDIEAIRLLGEAGKRIEHYRQVNPTYRERLLPGETKE